MVIGAGIAGLTTARALALGGSAVRVVEQAEALGEVGAGLQIAPNGFAVLEALGLGDAARAAGRAAEGVRLVDGLSGRTVLHLDLRRHAPGATWLFLHRPRLIELLARGAEAAGARIETGRAVLRVEDGAAAATLAFAGPDAAQPGSERGRSHEEVPPSGSPGNRRGPGELPSGDALADRKANALLDHAALIVGADGLHSRVRSALLGEARPVFTGQVAWRALVADDGALPEAQIWMGPGRHLVTYPLPGGLRNIVAVEERRDWTAESWSAEDDPDRLRAAFAGFAAPVRRWLGRVERVHLWGLFRHPVALRWFGSRVALAGDAAHPTLPFLAQGANLALEDAWVLADSLARQPLPEALRAYQDARHARVTRAVAEANSNAWRYHLRPPFRAPALAALRLAGALRPAAPLRRLDWLYRHDVTRP